MQGITGSGVIVGVVDNGKEVQLDCLWGTYIATGPHIMVASVVDSIVALCLR